MKKRLPFVKVTQDMPPEVHRFADKVNTLLREERHAHKMAVRWRRKVIRSGVPADFARKYPMTIEGHVGRMLQKWIIRERKTREKINACKRRYWRALTGDGVSPRHFETRLRYAPIGRPGPDNPHNEVRSDQERGPDVESQPQSTVEASDPDSPQNANPVARAGVANIGEDAGASAAVEGCIADTSTPPILQLAALNDWNIPPELAQNLECPLADLHLSIRSSNVLQRLGILTLRDLLRQKPARIMAAKNCGQKSISEIQRKLFGYLRSNAGPHCLSDCATQDSRWVLTPPFKGNLNLAMEQLCLSRRAENVVAAAGAKTVLQLINTPKTVVAEAPGCGARTIAEIEAKLREYVENGTCCGVDIVRGGTKTLCDSILALLSEREQIAMKRRYGLWDGTFATLEAVGLSLGVTRERIRQIEEAARERLVKRAGRTVSLYLKRRISEMYNEIAANELPEDALLTKFADDCTVTEARLALHFLGNVQSLPAIRFYDRALAPVSG